MFSPFHTKENRSTEKIKTSPKVPQLVHGSLGLNLAPCDFRNCTFNYYSSDSQSMVRRHSIIITSEFITKANSPHPSAPESETLGVESSDVN